MSVKEKTDEPRRYDLWLQGFRRWGDQDGDDAHTGYSYIDIDLCMNRRNGDIESTYGSLYRMFFKGRFYVGGALTYGTNDYNNDCTIEIG